MKKLNSLLSVLLIGSASQASTAYGDLNSFDVTNDTGELGNAANCVQTITVRDAIPPEITGCPNAPIDLGLNPTTLPNCADALALVTVSDFCDGAVTLTCSAVAVAENGCQRSQSFTLTVTDTCGNHSDCVVTYN